MENNSGSIEDIKAIRKLMEESTRFLSLSGLSGIFAGTIAVAGALAAKIIVFQKADMNYKEFITGLAGNNYVSEGWQLLAVAATVLVLAVAVSLFFSFRKTKLEGKAFWTPASKRLLMNLLVPLVTGGIFIAVLIIQGYVQLIIPSMLVFYGLSLVNAGKFTFGEIFYLGLLEIATGLASAFLPSLGLLLWTIGFGILHIVYGIAMYRKYEA
jgi:hypothetical protein